MIQYSDDLYEPRNCNYTVLYEIEGYALKNLAQREPACQVPTIVGWVSSPLKDRVLQKWKDHNEKITK